MNQESTNPDFDRIMHRNLADIFGEHDPEKRLQTLEALYTPDAELIDPEGIAQGHTAISAQVAALHELLPKGLVFTPTGPAVGHHGAGRLPWQAGIPGEPPMLTGIDFALFEGDLIRKLYVFVDPQT